MTDREKMICAIERAKKQSEEYAQDRIFVPFREADMIISLLREQEPVEPKWIDFEDTFIGYKFKVPLCGVCESALLYDVLYCPRCGTKVKWDD